MAGTAGKPGSYTGTYGQFRVDWAVTPHTSFAIEAVRFDVSDVIRQAVRLAYNLFTQKPKGEKDDFLNWTKTSKYQQGNDYFRHNVSWPSASAAAAHSELPEHFAAIYRRWQKDIGPTLQWVMGTRPNTLDLRKVNLVIREAGGANLSLPRG